MAQTRRTTAGRGTKSLRRTTDTLSTMLAEEVKVMNTRQKAARKEGGEGEDSMKQIRDATSVLKDLTNVTKTLSEQKEAAEGGESGVVLLPEVEEQ